MREETLTDHLDIVVPEIWTFFHICFDSRVSKPGTAASSVSCALFNFKHIK